MVTKKNDMNAAYDEIAPFYAEYSYSRSNYLESVEREILNRLRPELKLLDIGSGDGRRLRRILDSSGITYCISIEPSAEMARLCRENVGVPVFERRGELLDEVEGSPFDVITAMWNVFGHVPTDELRLQTLKNLKNLLKRDGIIIFDVNNRHNANSYGKFNVMKRRIIDFFNFDTKRGDARYDWRIGDKVFQGKGHLFIHKEVTSLIYEAGFQINEVFTIDYDTGEKSSSKFNGQLFYCLRHI